MGRTIPYKTFKGKGEVMDEKLFRKMKTIGAGNLACGIIVIVAGLATGIVLIVNGARLLAHKSDRLF